MVFVKNYYLALKFEHIVNYLTIKLSIIMKKLMSLLVAVALVAFMTSCGAAEEAGSQDQAQEVVEQVQEAVEQVQEQVEEAAQEAVEATEEMTEESAD